MVTPKVNKNPDAFEVDLVKTLYVYGDKPLEHWAQEMGISKRELNRIAGSGTADWHRLRQEFQERRMQYFKNTSKDILVERQSVAYRIEMLTILSIHQRINEIEEHYKIYGDFYMRNEDGEFILDGHGAKVQLQMPNTPREILALKSIEDIRVNNEKNLVNKVAAEVEDMAAKRSLATKKSVGSLFEAEIEVEASEVQEKEDAE